MARKNLLAGLIGTKLPDGNLAEERVVSWASDRRSYGASWAVGSRGAIGAVTRSIESLKTAASEAEQMRAQLEAGQVVVELDPALVDPSPVADRMGDTTGDASDFIDAIRITGQQVPILVRPHPDIEGRYQIAYGHRRARAARELGRPVRASRSSNERCGTCRRTGPGEQRPARSQFHRAGAICSQTRARPALTAKRLMAALNVDKTGLSRLISVAVKIPRDVIEAVGPAPKIGRDRWTDLVD